MVTVQDLKDSFPEFDLGPGNDVQNTLLAVKLAEAETLIDRSLFATVTQADTAIKYQTAQLVALSPAGMNAKLANKDGSTIYDRTLVFVTRAATFGFRVP